MVLSAGIIPIYRKQSGVKFLILRSFQYWDFPKGEVESGEDPWHSAQRELQEETGIVDATFPWGNVFTETEPYGPKKKIARYYIAEVTSQDVTLGINEQLGHPEHHEYRWVGFVEAEKLLGPRVLQVLAWAQSQIEN